MIFYCNQTEFLWGISSAGRALGSQSRGQGFDPPILHQKKKDTQSGVFFLFGS